MASTDSAASTLGTTALLGLTTANLFGNALGTDQSSGVDYGSLNAQANALSLTALDTAQNADAANKALVSDTIMPAVTNQLGVASTSASNMQDTAGLVGGYSAADRAKAEQLDAATTQYANEVASYGTASDQERAASKASQTALAQNTAARESAINTLQDMGVDTGSGKLASAIMQSNLQGAASAADAANTARETTRAAGINARATATQIGNTLTNTATNEATQAATIDANAATTAGQGISNAVSAGTLATSGSADVTSAANLGVNANVGIAKAQAADSATYAALNNQSSSNLGSAVSAALGSSGVSSALGSAATSIGNAISNGASTVGDWLSDWWSGIGKSGSSDSSGSGLGSEWDDWMEDD